MEARRGGGDAAEVENLAAGLSTIIEGSPPALSAVVDPLAHLLTADKVLACGLSPAEHGFTLEGAYSRGLKVAENRSAIEALLHSPLGAAPDDDGWPSDPRQRNVALTAEDIEALEGRTSGLPWNVTERLGIAGLDTLRVLLCDGPALLAWVGAFRSIPFSSRDRALLQSVVPYLEQRLDLERRHGRIGTPATAVTVTEVLESLRSEVFVMRGDGSIAHANSAGRELLERDPGEPIDALRASQTGRNTGGFYVTPLHAPDASAFYLVVRQSPHVDPGQRSATLASQFHLTARQRQVLALLARGQANKAIGATLGCAEGTVELHVTAVLTKLGCSSRAEAIARFWTDS